MSHTPPVCATDLITIVQGSSERIIATITNCDDSAYDLTGMEGASAIFKSGTDGSPVIKTFAASGIEFEGAETKGQLAVLLTTSDSALLYPGEEQTWVLYIDMPSPIFKKVLYKESLTVEEDPVASF